MAEPMRKVCSDMVIRPLRLITGSIQASSFLEDLRGKQGITKSISMRPVDKAVGSGHERGESIAYSPFWLSAFCRARLSGDRHPSTL